ncbi:hypothetical protein SAMN06295924_1167 [Rathayibacter rathayi NCPPB 2980 = VKM Ac-1601]|nr:hypothetical protein FB469_3124 [Rathayibacter rathayi]SOE05844.1 hypothetical protein SAMN06295924_1167 [Rathayibacter rathayi NCPPB 2980 = VKM Ac-1601]
MSDGTTTDPYAGLVFEERDRQVEKLKKGFS